MLGMKRKKTKREGKNVKLGDREEQNERRGKKRKVKRREMGMKWRRTPQIYWSGESFGKYAMTSVRRSKWARHRVCQNQRKGNDFSWLLTAKPNFLRDPSSFSETLGVWKVPKWYLCTLNTSGRHGPSPEPHWAGAGWRGGALPK